MSRANCVERWLDRRAQPAVRFRPGPDCRWSIAASLSASGRMLATAASCSRQELRRRGQQIAARGAFGAADLQQQVRELAFDLDGVHHRGAVLARLVDQQDRGCADRRPAPEIPPQAAGFATQRAGAERQASQMISRHEANGIQAAPAESSPTPHQRRSEPIGSTWHRRFFGVGVSAVRGWPARYCSSQWIW